MLWREHFQSRLVSKLDLTFDFDGTWLVVACSREEDLGQVELWLRLIEGETGSLDGVKLLFSASAHSAAEQYLSPSRMAIAEISVAVGSTQEAFGAVVLNGAVHLAVIGAPTEDAWSELASEWGRLRSSEATQ